MIEKST